MVASETEETSKRAHLQNRNLCKYAPPGWGGVLKTRDGYWVIPLPGYEFDERLYRVLRDDISVAFEPSPVLFEFLQFVEKLKVLTLEGQKAACEVIQQDAANASQARWALAAVGFRVVINQIETFLEPSVEGYHLADADLLQEGLISLHNAAAEFDYKKSNFQAYCNFRVFRALERAVIDCGHLVRLPVYMYAALVDVEKYVWEYWSDCARRPTVAGIRSNSSMIDGQHLLQAIASRRISPSSSARELFEQQWMEKNFLPEHFSQSDDNGLAPSAKDPQFKDVRDVITCCRLLNALSWRHKAVLSLRYGVGSCERQRTLSEVGKIFGLTRERVRQLESKALSDLRSFLEGEGA